MVVGVLVTACAVLLLVAGVAKLRTPDPAAAMVQRLLGRSAPGLAVRRRAVRRRSAQRVVRGAACVEVAAGIAVLATGSVPAVVLLGLCYLVLLAVAVRFAAAGDHRSCGCFGSADGPVGSAHIVLDAMAFAVACWAIVRPPGSMAALFDHGVLVGVTACAQAGVLAALGYLSITALPALTAARGSVEVR